MEISQSKTPLNFEETQDNSQNILNNESHKSSVPSRSNSTGDFSAESYVSDSIIVQNNNNNERDISKLMSLLNKEKSVWSQKQEEVSYKKPTFLEIKNNVQIIQHNIDNFFIISNKKMLKKLKKEEEI